MPTTLRYFVKVRMHRTDPTRLTVHVTHAGHTYTTTRMADDSTDAEHARGAVTELFDVDGYALSALRGAGKATDTIVVTAKET